MSRTPYPKYVTYESAHRSPSVLAQEFRGQHSEMRRVTIQTNPLLRASSCRRRTPGARVGAASFCAFLEDTVEVEHCLVIPAVAAVRRLPYELPSSGGTRFIQGRN